MRVALPFIVRRGGGGFWGDEALVQTHQICRFAGCVSRSIRRLPEYTLGSFWCLSCSCFLFSTTCGQYAIMYDALTGLQARSCWSCGAKGRNPMRRENDLRNSKHDVHRKYYHYFTRKRTACLRVMRPSGRMVRLSAFFFRPVVGLPMSA